jgi:hypothetical protein
MQKALMQMNVQLHHVVSDITGATGMKILRAIVAGTHEPATLASYRDVRCKASDAAVCQAMTGNYRREHFFALRQALELYDSYQAKVVECDREIEAVLDACMPIDRPTLAAPPKARYKGRPANEPAFNMREALGIDLTQLQGSGAYTALMLIGEYGTDMTKWPTAKHFTSWRTSAPGNKISGGKLLSAKTRRSANRAAKWLRLAAVNVGRTQTALGGLIDAWQAGWGKPRR